MKLRFSALPAVILFTLTSCSHLRVEEDPELKAAFDRCRTISEEIASIRQLEFSNDVTVKVQSKDDFIKYIEKEVDEQYGSKEDVQSYVDALVLLGALKERVEFADTLKEMMVSQAAAHYDPRNNVYYLLMSDMDPFFVDVISSHELCHALQDQNFDLTAMIMDDPKAMQDNGDAALAKQCLAEGDATLVMMWWALKQQMADATQAQLSAAVSLAVGVQATMDFDMILSLAKDGVFDSGLGMGSLANSIKDLDNFPRFFMESLYMAYIRGAVAVDHVRTRGGWKAVDELFRNPPSSSEQILHPEKLLGERDEPVDVRIPSLVESPPAGWRLAEQDVLGELGVRILLATWKDESVTNAIAPDVAAAGWGGDRYYYLRDEVGSELLVWKTVWDSLGDASEFMSALQSTIRLRYPTAKQLAAAPASPGADCRGWSVDGKRRLTILKHANSVSFVSTPHDTALTLEVLNAVKQ